MPVVFTRRFNLEWRKLWRRSLLGSMVNNKFKSFKWRSKWNTKYNGLYNKPCNSYIYTTGKLLGNCDLNVDHRRAFRVQFSQRKQNDQCPSCGLNNFR